MSKESLKQTKKVAFCGIISALSLVVMLTAYFPYLTYAIPAFAGAFLIMVVVELGVKWAFLTYIVTSILCLIGAEREAMTVYILFFGYYPIIKYVLEKLNKTVVEYVLKIVIVNMSAVAIYFVCTAIIGISAEEFSGGIKYAIPILLVALNIMFIVYDIALNR